MSFEWLLPQAFDLSAAVAMVTVSRAVWKMTTTTTTTTTSGVRMSSPHRTTTPTPFSPRQPSARGDDAGGLLECRGGHPRPPVKYNRRRCRRTPSAPTRLHGRVYIQRRWVYLRGWDYYCWLALTYNFQSSFVIILYNTFVRACNEILWQTVWKNWAILHDHFWRHNTIDRFEMISP